MLKTVPHNLEEYLIADLDAAARVTIQKGRLTRGRRFVPDSALEEAGFELFVPLRISASPS
jgi:hypothetical protein